MNAKQLFARGYKLSKTGKRVGYELAKAMVEIKKHPESSADAESRGTTVEDELQKMMDNAFPINDGFEKLISVLNQFPKQDQWKSKTFKELYDLTLEYESDRRSKQRHKKTPKNSDSDKPTAIVRMQEKLESFRRDHSKMRDDFKATLRMSEQTWKEKHDKLQKIIDEKDRIITKLQRRLHAFEQLAKESDAIA